MKGDGYQERDWIIISATNLWLALCKLLCAVDGKEKEEKREKIRHMKGFIVWVTYYIKL